MAKLQIFRVGVEPAVRLAATELRKYLARATGAGIAVRPRRHHSASCAGIWVGTFAGLEQAGSGNEEEDAILIDAGRQTTLVAGSNPRSVLLAVYRYLTELPRDDARTGN